MQLKRWLNLTLRTRNLFRMSTNISRSMWTRNAKSKGVKAIAHFHPFKNSVKSMHFIIFLNFISETWKFHWSWCKIKFLQVRSGFWNPKVLLAVSTAGSSVSLEAGKKVCYLKCRYELYYGPCKYRRRGDEVPNVPGPGDLSAHHTKDWCRKGDVW